MRRKINIRRKLITLLILLTFFNNFIPILPFTVNAAGNTKMGAVPSSSQVTLGESLTITVWLDGDEGIDGWKLEEFNWTAGKANMTTRTCGWWDWTWDSGTIHNDTGWVEDVQGGKQTQTTENQTAVTFGFTPKELGTCNFWFGWAKAFSGGPEVPLTTYNTSIVICPGSPTDLQISSQSQDHPSYNHLSWNITPNVGIDNVVVNYRTDHVPTSATAGTEIYNGTGTYFNHTNVPIESNMYYAAWGWNNTENMHSVTSTNKTVDTENPLPATFTAEAVSGDNHSINLTWTLSPSIPLNTLNLYPNGQGSSTQWTPSLGQNWECVDETSADDWSSYVSTNPPPTPKWDSYEIQDTAASGTITDVNVTARLYGSSGTANIVIYNGVSQSDGPTITFTPPAAFTDYSHSWTDNPWTSSSWTWNDIDSLEIGIETSTPSIYCTQVYATISYQDQQTIYIEHNSASGWSIGSGTEVYNSTATNHTDTGLSSNTRYYYQAWVYDSTDNVYSTSYKSDNAVTNGPNSPPTITAVNTPANANTSETITINVTVTDADGVDTVWLNGRYGTSPYHDDFNSSMTNTAGNYYERSITVLSNSTDNLSYWITANDTSDAWSISSVYTCNVTDNEPPVPIDNTPSTTIVAGGGAFFLVNCTDNIAVASVTIEYIQGAASGTISLTLENGTVQNGNWSGTYNVPLDNANNISYTINATDTSGNSNTSVTGSITVSDGTPPTIAQATIEPSSGPMGTSINISSEITDNIAIDTVHFNITSPNATSTNASITSKTGDTYYDNSTYSQRGNYTLVIYANDTSNNLNSSSAQTFTILNRAPSITNPSPANQTTNANPHGFIWNVTITDLDNDLINWTITCSNGESTGSNNEASGSKNLTLTDANLDFNTNYTVWVNVSDGNESTNKTFWFKTRVAIDPALPSSFTASAYNRTAINLSWTPGGNASHTYIEHNTTANWAKGTGSGQWNCTNTSFNHTGLTPNTKYYYQAWSYNATDNTWSNTNISASATTNNQVPTFDEPQPANGSTNQALTVNWSINISDSDSDTFNWWINCSVNDNNGSSASDGRYNVTLSSLGFNTTYTVNVTAIDTYGGRNTSTYNFTTRSRYYPSIPTDFTASAYNRTAINLTWTWPSQYADSVVILAQQGATAPSTTPDGTGEEYNDTGTSWNDTQLDANTQYSYSIWSYNATDNVYSQTYNTTTNTTLANTAPQFNGENPSNTSENVDITQSIVNVTISDTNSDTMTWYINGTYVDNNSSTSSGGNIQANLSTPLLYNTTITWYVNVTDGFTWTNETYQFTTRDYYVPSPPTSFTATAFNKTTIDISWTNAGTNYTIVEFINGSSYPTGGWARGSGKQIYNGTGTSVRDSNHTAQQKVYYQAWSWNATDGNYSTTNASANATTLTNVPPSLQGEHPSNNTVNVDITQSSVNVTIIDNDENMNWNITVYNATGGLIGSNDSTDVVTGSNISCTFPQPLDWNTTITWFVNVSDGFNWTNATYQFTTRDKYYPPAPLNFTGTAYNKTAINLTWTWPTQYADRVCINYTQGNTPPTNTTGFDYNGTATSWNISGLTVDTNYSFSIWGYNETENVYTRTPANVTISTLANYAPQASTELPTNQTTGVDIDQATVNVTVTDANSEDTIDWNISVYNGSGTMIASNESTNAANGTKISCNLTTPLNFSENYTWYVNLSDGCDGFENTSYWFIVRGSYQPTTPALTATTYNTTQINLAISAGANTSHIRVEYKNSSNWTRGQGNLIQNNTNTSANITGLSPHTIYYFQAWGYNATDNLWSTVNSTNTTTDNTPVNTSHPNPANDSTNANPHGFVWSVNITDADGDTFNWTITCSNGENTSGSNESDGKKNLTLTDNNLTYNTQYTIWVNATDGYNNTNATYLFTTRAQFIPDPPTGFSATPYNQTAINLTWNNIGTNKTYVERNTINTWTRGSGTNLTGTTDNTAYNDTGLINGTHYYYRAWSYNETDSCYSTTSAAASAYTAFENNILIYNPQPADLATNILITRSNVIININSTDGSQFNYTITGSNLNTATGINKTNLTATATITTLNYGTQYTWTVCVNNSNGWANVSFSFTTNYKPVLSLSVNPSSGNPPLTTTISYTIDDIDGSIINATLNLGDGTSVNVTQNASGTLTHTYSSTGTYSVQLTAVDNQSATNTATSTITVTSSGGGDGDGDGGDGGGAVTEPLNVAPIADAGGPYTGYVNETVTFNGSGSSDSDGTIVNYTWDFGDGTVGYGVNSTHNYTMAAVYNVTLTVIDNSGSTANDTTTVNITKKADGFLFDVELELTDDSVFIGENISVLITLINVGEPGLVNCTVNYTLYKGEEVIWSYEEILSVLGQIVLTKSIETQGLSAGDYIFEVVHYYGDNQSASAKSVFTVNEGSIVVEPPSEKYPYYIIIIILIILLVIIMLLICYKKGYLCYGEKSKGGRKGKRFVLLLLCPYKLLIDVKQFLRRSLFKHPRDELEHIEGDKEKIDKEIRSLNQKIEEIDKELEKLDED